jgi:UDP-2,3-diacylglucosamine pyrophosphatase LpxH
MSIGDFIEGYSEDKNELNSQWDEFDSLVNKSRMPFFYVPGNHDISNEVMAKKWRQRLGRSYYHFTYRGVLFLCLNTEDPTATNISDRQLDYFRNVLKANKNVRRTLVFMHKPMWAEQSSDDWPKFEELLAGRAYTVFCGHKHKYSKVLRNDRRYYVLATTGGTGGDNQENKCQFDHVVWVTMTDDGPAMANLLLEGILDDEPCVSPQ